MFFLSLLGFIIPNRAQNYNLKINHKVRLFNTMVLSNQLDKQQYYDIQPLALPYIQELNNTTQNGFFYLGYGTGVGITTKKYLFSSTMYMYCFQEKRTNIDRTNKLIKNNGYFYNCIRNTFGKIIKRNRIYLIPQIDYGLNIYGRSEGKNIDPHNFSQVTKVSRGLYENDKFKSVVHNLSISAKAGYSIRNYIVYSEPYYTIDISNTIKKSEPYKLYRYYWGVRMGFLFYFY